MEEPSGREGARASKKEMLNTFKTILFIVIIVFVIRYFRLNYLQIISLFVSIRLVFAIKDLYKGKDLQAVFLSSIKDCLKIVVFVLVLHWLSLFGFWGYTLGTVLIIVYVMVTRWKQYMMSLRRIETLIYGKALDKENWKSQKPKVKIVWGKK